MTESLFQITTIATQRYFSGCRVFVGLLLLVLLPTYAFAQSFADGKAAYEAKDYKTALKILKPLAEQGDSQAQVTLGVMYDYGQGVAKNPEEAMNWYIKAAKQGIPVVQHDVGVKYFQGMGVPQSYEKAAYWWEQSANAGLADSQFNLGLMYYRGLGLKQDYNKAIELFKKAAKQGHSHAQYSLAVMNAFGQGMEKNYTEALKWFRKSANQGVPQAQFNLGVFYENGYGLEKNIETAKEWYTRAANQGLEEAKKKLAKLAESNSKQTATVAQTETPSNKQPEVETAETDNPQTANSENGLKREDWVLQQSPDSYTLQLSSVLAEKDILKFIHSNHLESEAAYIKVIVNDTTRYTAIYGVYSTYIEAQNAIKQLPENLQRDKPWVRNFGILQKMLH